MIPLRYSKSKRIVIFTIFSIFLLLVNTAAHAQQVNYSGDWKINPDKTEFSKVFSRNSVPVEIRITQKNDSIGVTRTSKNAKGETHVNNEMLSFSGIPVEVMVGSTRKTASIAWSANGQSLIELARYEDDTAPEEYREYKATETWSLSEGGKVLIIVRVDLINEMNDSTKMVYEK